MKKIGIVVFFIHSFVFLGFGQNFSLEIPLNLKRSADSHYTQTVDLKNYQFADFVAVSLRLEGKGMNSESVRISLKTADTLINLKHFHEEDIEDKYVSELIYLSKENLTSIDFTFDFDNKIAVKDIKGIIRLFSPVEVKQNDRIKKKTACRDYSDCSCQLPDFVTRTTWGSGFNLNESIYSPPATYTDVTHLIVHHSAGTNSSSNWSGVVAAIFDYHVNTNGWQDIGYNWLIDPNGVLYEGRGGGNNVRGAHMCGHNDYTMGICILGTYTSVLPDTNAISKLVKLLAWKCCETKIDPIGSSSIPSYYNYMKNISGHRDGCAPNYTECPGNTLYLNLDSIRLKTFIHINTTCSPISYSEQYIDLDNFYLYPNPVFEVLKVYQNDFESFEETTFEIFDINGKKLLSENKRYINSEIEVSVSFLPKGMYFLKLKNNRNVIVKNFLKM